MNDRLAHYIDRVRAICAQPLSPRATLSRVGAAAEDLVAEPLPLAAADRFAPPNACGRNLLYRDEEHGFVVIAMVWPPGSGGLPHDHGTWGVVAVSEGAVDITSYEREDNGCDPQHARLTPLGGLRAQPGTVGTVLPPHDEFHQVRNEGADVAVTIHTYGMEIESCHAFDLERGSCEPLHPAYTNEGSYALDQLGTGPRAHS